MIFETNRLVIINGKRRQALYVEFDRQNGQSYVEPTWWVIDPESGKLTAYFNTHVELVERMAPKPSRPHPAPDLPDDEDVLLCQQHGHPAWAFSPHSNSRTCTRCGFEQENV